MNIKSLLGFSTAKKVRITLRKACFLTLPSGETIQGQEGEIYEVTERVAGQLVAQAIAIDPVAETAKANRVAYLNSMLPPAREPRPLPDGWGDLPPCFEKFHKLNEAGLCLIHRARAIEEMLIAKVITKQPTFKGLEHVPSGAKSAVFGSINIPAGEAVMDDASGYLRDALRRAEEAVDQWRETNGIELQRLTLQCSDTVFSIHGELNRTCRELRETALALFGTRVAALGLHPQKVSQLFDGSADFLNFAAPAEKPGLDDIKVLWNEDGGRDCRFILGKPVLSMASLWQVFTTRNRDLTALLKTAKSELAKAAKVQAAA